MPAVRNEPRTRKIDKSHIVRRGIFHKLENQMMYRRVFRIILPVRVVGVVEDTVRIACVLAEKSLLLLSDVEPPVYLRYLFGKQLAHELNPLLAALESASRGTVTSPFGF